ncbi:MAG: dihydrodipicolinate synthase family protein, partial [Dialister sp.]|uniref:dihydrodipicolinate synthase family protein n=1 Tax=Dialister sp. TaxID=1955814 RepID=UPI00257CB7C1
MANAKFGRVITAMITPFTADGEVDYEGAVTLAKHLVEHGSEGILVGGTTFTALGSQELSLREVKNYPLISLG